jgi:hypothetical protein
VYDTHAHKQTELEKFNSSVKCEINWWYCGKVSAPTFTAIANKKLEKGR